MFCYTDFKRGQNMNTLVLVVALVGTFMGGFVSAFFFIRFMAKRKLKRFQQEIYETLIKMEKELAKTNKPTEPKWN